ncbi:MAG: sulfite exporter TauE/SafE family protein [Treponema sp.]|jgi:uncharacterized membrane protein YfcA|nr:sulfite exporter TauE/SafE family protein [Treponema sp.]
MLYFLLAFAATAFGAATGMGGGIFMKPVLDLVGRQDVASISVLSSATVFVMALITLVRRRKVPERPAAGIAVPLSAGAVAGGFFGEKLFGILVDSAPLGNVKITQNAILIGLIAVVIVYMIIKNKAPSLGIAGKAPSFAAGSILGLISSFLGIGGGPVNVALIVFAFGFTIKMAMQCSLFTILFSQGSKLITVVLVSNTYTYDLSMLPVMIAGGAVGGFVGSALNARLDAKSCDVLFCIAQAVVILICVLNIAKNL